MRADGRTNTRITRKTPGQALAAGILDTARRAVGCGLTVLCALALVCGFGTAAWADNVQENPQGVAVDAGTEYKVKVALNASDDAETGIVTVTAPEGALPEGATLNASLVQGDKDTKAVADELDKAEVSYDGFTALDVHFTDADGNEVEPTEAVDVKLELPQGALGDDVDASTLAVRHLAEDDKGEVEKVDTVAQTADTDAQGKQADNAGAAKGTVELANDGTVTADFSIDSFSRFTITWSNGQITIQRITADGNGIGHSGEYTVGKADRNDWLDLENLGNGDAAISGYRFYKAVILRGNVNASQADSQGTEISAIRYQDGSWRYRRGSTGNGNQLGSNYTIYFIYEPDDNPGGTTDPDDQVKVYVYVAGSGISDECLDLLGIDPDTLDQNRYFPAGVISLDKSFFDSKGQAAQTPGAALITDGDDWDAVLNALGDLDTSTLADKTDRSVWREDYDRKDYSGNRDNHVGDYLSQARGDVGYTWGSQHTALFRWHENPYSAANVHCGFTDQSVEYHLDLFFTTNTIKFVLGDNGIESGNAADRTTVDNRAYITGSEIQPPEGLNIPNGYYFDGYYEDSGFTIPWNGIGEPLDSDQTVYIKLTQDPVLALTLTKEVVGTTVEDHPFTFTLATSDEDVAGQTYKTSANNSVTFSEDPNDEGNYVAQVTFSATTQNGVDGSIIIYGLPTGTEYTVTENNSSASVSGYALDVAYAVNGKTGNVVMTQGSDLTQTVSVTNTYTPSVEMPEADPDIRKYVADGKGDTYGLSLDVTGTTIKETRELNVLYILDDSYSMMWDMDGTYPDINEGDDGPNPSGDNEYPNNDVSGEPYQYSYERYIAALNAIRLLNNTLSSNDGLDVQTALVEFAETAFRNTSWGPLDSFHLPSATYDTFETGTNYGSAFHVADQVLAQLPEDRQEAETVVVFVTDGTPNRATLDGQGSTVGAQEGIDFGKRYIDDLDVDRLYAIGVSDDIGLNNLQDLIGSVQEGVEADAFQSNDAAEIAQHFAQIAAEISGSVTQNVTITDELSEYAQLVDASASPEISIVNASGEPVGVTSRGDLNVDPGTGVATQYFVFKDRTDLESEESSDQVLTYTYYPAGQHNGNEHPVVTLSFPEDYALTQGWIYTLTLQIEPTEAAYSHGNASYPDTGDAQTDVPGLEESKWISSGKLGFHSNTSASLTYNDGAEKKYPNPVIQVTVEPVTLQVLKYADGEGGIADSYDEGADQLLGGAKFDLYSDPSCTQHVGSQQETGSDQNAEGYGIATFADLTPGTYYLKETQASPDYQTPSTVWKIEVTGTGVQMSISNGFDADGTPTFGDLRPVSETSEGSCVYQIQLQNVGVVDLPSSGNSGTVALSAAGVAAVAVAGAYLARRKGLIK